MISLPERADSPVLGFDGAHSPDPLRYPSPNFPRDLCRPSAPAPDMRASLLSMNPRNAVYLPHADASALASYASIDSYSEDKLAALDHIRALYDEPPSQVYGGPSSRWSVASSLHTPANASTRSRKRITSILSRLSTSLNALTTSTTALTTSTTHLPDIPEPREMQKAYLARDDPPIALDLRPPTHQSMLTLNSVSSSSSYGYEYPSSSTTTTPYTSPPLSPVTSPSPSPKIKTKRGLKALFSRCSLLPPRPERLTIILAGRPIDVRLPPSPQGPPPVPPKDVWHRVGAPEERDEYIRARGSGLDERGRVEVGVGVVVL